MSKLEKRRLLKHLYEHGIKNPNKLAELTGVSRMTAYNVIKRLSNGEGIERRAGSGRPRKVSGPDVRRLSAVARHNRKLGYRKISQRFNRTAEVPISHETARQALRRQGFRSRNVYKIPQITDRHRQTRVEFAIHHQNDDFNDVFFTDEAMFQLEGNKLKVISKTKVTSGVSKFPQRIMIWGGISLRGSTTLAIIDSSVNSAVYCQTISGHLLQTGNVLYPEGYRLQQDNARCHTSRETRRWLENNNINTIRWPAASPDLNPVENIWHLMKIEVERQAPRNKAELKTIVDKTWSSVTEQYAERLILSMPERLRKCIAREGECVSRSNAT